MKPSTTFKTEETDALCREIAKKSNGVCLLSFSGGKDSVCAWIYLQNYFKRIIPIHFASYPQLKSRETMLRYYEDAFETHILRLMGEEVSMCLARGAYQDASALNSILELDTPDWSKLDGYEFVRKTFSLPRAWCAVGIGVGDSIDRRIYCKKTGGKNPQNLTFYPCWDWNRSDVLMSVRNSGLKLSDEYLWQNRSLGGVPSQTCNDLFREHWHEDYERIQAIYPMAEAKTYRERMLDVEWERRKAMGIIDDTDGEVSATIEIAGADTMSDVMGSPEEWGEDSV